MIAGELLFVMSVCVLRELDRITMNQAFFNMISRCLADAKFTKCLDSSIIRRKYVT